MTPEREALLEVAGAARMYRMDARTHRRTLLDALMRLDIAQGGKARRHRHRHTIHRGVRVCERCGESMEFDR